MLYLAQPKAGERLVDLGSGDGRIVIEAAKRFGATGLGVDIDPQLVNLARANAKRAGVEALARFEVQDLFETDLRGVNVVTMYLLPEVNLQAGAAPARPAQARRAHRVARLRHGRLAVRRDA